MKIDFFRRFFKSIFGIDHLAFSEKAQVEPSNRVQEQTLRDGNERFRKVFEISPVAITVTQLSDGRLMEANQAFWNLAGLKRRPSARQPWT